MTATPDIPRFVSVPRQPASDACHSREFSSTTWCTATNGKRKGKTTKVKLQDLPQGMISSDPLPEADPEPEPTVSYPTVVQQARDNMRKFDGCVVLTRVGSFYELYFEQAHYWGSQLNLKVACKRTSAGPVAMAGFPFYQLDRYLKVLVQEFGKHVAISEETANDPAQKVKSGGLLFDRQVKRIITPGTLIDENFISPNAHNYLLAVYMDLPEHGAAQDSALDSSLANVGLAWLDLSSGDFHVQQTDLSALASAINRIGPGEVIFDKRLHGTSDARLAGIIADCGQKMTFYEMPTRELAKGIEPILDDTAVDFANDSFSIEETRSANCLLEYIKEQLPGLKLRLQPPQRFQVQDHMSIDKHTVRGLELLRTMKDGAYQGSLLHAIRRTSTRSGARLLAERLTSPSLSLQVIAERLDLVEALIADENMLDNTTSLLRSTTDSFRLVQSLACGKGDAEDLLSLSRTIALSQDIASFIKQHSPDPETPLLKLTGRFHWDGPAQLAGRILHAIDEESLMERRRKQEDDAAEAAGIARDALSTAEGEDLVGLSKRLSSKKYAKVASEADEDARSSDDIWVMRRDASGTLMELHTKLEDLHMEKSSLAAELRTQLNAPSLTLRISPGLGHFLHVKGRDTKVDLSTTDARVISITKSTKSIHLPAWTELGARIEDAKWRIRGEELQILKRLREGVCEEIVSLRRNAGVIDDLDVACSGAILAKERNLVRPILDNSTSMTVIAGRHMTVEASLEASGRSFTPNDCFLGLPSSTSPETNESIHILTGPNMAGKSTYLRTLAHLPILAQTGHFVPATHANLGLVDAVFSRIGASDDLAHDQSTFMVEMVEAAAILRRAGPKSLVVMDEVGRGTTPEDGLAVGYAVLERLKSKGCGRVLFATHFHALAEEGICGAWEEVACWCTRVVEEGGEGEGIGDGGRRSFRFDHKVRRGVNRDSHALRVARLAGMPEESVMVAARVLRDIKSTRIGY